MKTKNIYALFLFIFTMAAALFVSFKVNYATETPKVIFSEPMPAPSNPVSNSSVHQFLYTAPAKINGTETDSVELRFMNHFKSSPVMTRKVPYNCNTDVPVPHPDAPKHLVVFKSRVYPSNAYGTCFSYLRGKLDITYGDFFPGCENTPYPTACMSHVKTYTSGYGTKEIREQTDEYLNMESFLANKCSQIPESVREINKDKWTVIPENHVYPNLRYVEDLNDCTLATEGCIPHIHVYSKIEDDLLDAILPLHYYVVKARLVSFPWRYYPDSTDPNVMRDEWGSFYIPGYGTMNDPWVFDIRTYRTSPATNGLTITPTTYINSRYDRNDLLKYLTTIIVSRPVDPDLDKCRYYGY